MIKGITNVEYERVIEEGYKYATTIRGCRLQRKALANYVITHIANNAQEINNPDDIIGCVHTEMINLGTKRYMDWYRDYVYRHRAGKITEKSMYCFGGWVSKTRILVYIIKEGV